jgi:hypothetical protein
MKQRIHDNNIEKKKMEIGGGRWWKGTRKMEEDVEYGRGRREQDA